MKIKSISMAILSSLIAISGVGAFGLKNSKAENDDKIILLVGNANTLVNGKIQKISDGSVPFIDQSNRTLVPLRFVSEALSCKVDWDGTKKTITITANEKKSVLTIGSENLLVDGKSVKMSTVPVIKNDRVFVPLRDLSETILNKKVEWANEGLIGISSEGNLFTGDKNKIQGFIKELSGLETVATKEKYIELVNKINSEQEKLLVDYGKAAPSVAEDGAVREEAQMDSTANMAAGASSKAYSETNIQVAGVDEADIVKTDGDYIYYTSNGNVYIVDAKNPSNIILAKKLEFQNQNANSNFYPSEMYLDKNTLTIIGTYYEYQNVVPIDPGKPIIMEDSIASSKMIAYPFSNKTKVLIYDITNKSDIKNIKDFYIDGNYTNSRKINNNLYLITNNYVYGKIDSNTAVLPSYYDSNSGSAKAIDYTSLYCFPEINTTNLMSITAIDVNNPNENANIQTFLGASEIVYCSQNNLYVTSSNYKETTSDTKIFKFALNNGKITFAAQGNLPGSILNQFSMDEHNNYLRVATTENDWASGNNNSKNNLFILDSTLSTVGKLTDLAKGEQIKSARFMGDRIYLVTFETVDPLFAIDAKNPNAPKVLGELKIPGYSTYLHAYDENHLIGFGYDTKTENYYGVEVVRNSGLKMSLFDIKDISNPREMFTEIIGEEGSSSELLYNHKSLLFDKEKNLLAFPANVVKQKVEDINGATYFGNLQFNGALVYDISLNNGFKLKNQITHNDPNRLYDYGGNINRIIYIDSDLFTFSQNKIMASDMNSGAVKSSLQLENQQ